MNLKCFMKLSIYFVFLLYKVIKILGTEKGKKNKTNVVFIAGNRVRRYVEKSYSTEKSLTSLLK